MAVIKILTPPAIIAADYPVAQTPVLGGEKQVYLSTTLSRLLGVALVTDAAGTIDYKFVNTPSANPPGPIVAVALEAGVRQSAATTITFAGLSGALSPVEWASNQSVNFPTARAVELTGTYSAPTSSSVPTVAATMLQGSKFALIELPPLTAFILAGCTNNRRIKLPARGTKNIPCGMNEAEWTTPGRVMVGELEVTGLNQGVDDGLRRFVGLQTTAMLVTLRAGRIITQRDFAIDYTPEGEESYGELDNEATLTVRGQFSKMATLPAPGTP